MKKLDPWKATTVLKKNKEKVSKSSAAGTSEVYTSTWKFINELNFLNDNLVPPESFSNIKVDNDP